MGTKFRQQQGNLMDNGIWNIFIETLKEISHAGKLIISPTFCLSALFIKYYESQYKKMKRLSDIVASKNSFAVS